MNRRGKRLLDDLDQEIRDHIELATQENITIQLARLTFAAGAPLSASLSTPMICSSVNCTLFILLLLSQRYNRRS